MMGITFGDHLIDSGYHDITPEQEREIEAREECARHGIDPDEICADGGVTAWMVMDQDLVRARSVTCATCEDTGEIVWHHPEGGPSVEACPDCYQPGDCDGSCTHPEPDPRVSGTLFKTPCSGCGQEHANRRCIGCHHEMATTPLREASVHQMEDAR
jgi:hypothetical protein